MGAMAAVARAVAAETQLEAAAPDDGVPPPAAALWLPGLEHPAARTAVRAPAPSAASVRRLDARGLAAGKIGLSCMLLHPSWGRFLWRVVMSAPAAGPPRAGLGTGWEWAGLAT